jgi:hypothetical protein
MKMEEKVKIGKMVLMIMIVVGFVSGCSVKKVTVEEIEMSMKGK